jgi:carbon-monoxide dehydrogenase medium subunit
LAGGTDLLVKMKNRRVVPRFVVNLKGIKGLDRIEYGTEAGLKIGAMATIQALKNSSAVKRKCKILAQAAASESSVQVRNIATLGGNIANASPAADAPIALIAAGGSVVISSAHRQRVVLLENFATGPGRTVLQQGEIITEIRVPPLPAQTGVAYLKHSVRQTDIAIVGVGVVLRMQGNVCSSVKIVLGSVAPTVIRARQAEASLVGETLTDDLITRAAQLAGAESRPIDDIRQSAQYRNEAIIEAAKSTILCALEDANTGGL